MLRKSLHLTLLIGASVALSGCASIFGEKFAAKFKPSRSASASQASKAVLPDPSHYTNLGRSQLAAEQTGAALESFRLALAFREPAAPAYNGMGVAYVRLGNFEQAQELFRMAIEAAPTDEKYQANMARLMSSPLLAQRKDGDRAAKLAAAASSAKVATEAAASGRLTRVSRGEFHITTIPQSGDAPMARPTRTALAPSKAVKDVNRASTQADSDQPAPVPKKAQ
jgi:Flp pilus assembly protein TadD